MKCPVCKDVDLKIAERQGIEIDYCAKCRGVWLDRGELDKIIERSARLEREFETPKARPLGDLVDDDRYFDDDTDYPSPKRKNEEKYRQDDEYRSDKRERYDDRDDKRRYDKKRRRKSFFEEIFDEIFD
jgi:Zn-finger nucleic acid-binding protein